jgi:hypothetical protein
MNDRIFPTDLGRELSANRDDAQERRFTRADLDALSVHDDIKLKLTDDLAADIPEDKRGLQTALPHWSGAGPEEGAAIAVWQMLAPPPGVEEKLPSWLRKQGISYFRGWIRHCDPALGPDFVMDWVIPLRDGAYETARDGDAGPYSPPPPADLQTFVDAVVSLSRDLLLADLERKLRVSGRRPGDPGTVLEEFFPILEIFRILEDEDED